MFVEVHSGGAPHVLIELIREVIATPPVHWLYGYLHESWHTGWGARGEVGASMLLSVGGNSEQVLQIMYGNSGNQRNQSIMVGYLNAHMKSVWVMSATRFYVF